MSSSPSAHPCWDSQSAARCHDHKFDPLPQEDYYRLLSFFRGIWASAPYLHNGSIPNLDELLKRPAERSNATFRVGSREFDPVKVGFKTDSGEEFNPNLPGNTNGGHDYHHSDGRSFSETERKQLIEYLKSL